MSQKAKKYPYIYQPYGAVTHHNKDRLYGVGGVHRDATVKGLTKAEAEAVASLLRKMRVEEEDAGLKKRKV